MVTAPPVSIHTTRCTTSVFPVREGVAASPFHRLANGLKPDSPRSTDDGFLNPAGAWSIAPWTIPILQSVHAWWITRQCAAIRSGRAQALSAALPPSSFSESRKHSLLTMQPTHSSQSRSRWHGVRAATEGAAPMAGEPAATAVADCDLAICSSRGGQ